MRKRKNDRPYVEMSIPFNSFWKEVEKEILRLSVDSGWNQEDPSASWMERTQKALQNVFSGWFTTETEIRLKQYPLGSLAASGKASVPGAGVIVYVQGSGKHIPYARKWVYPTNPQTPDQQAHRDLFKKAMQSWQAQPDEIKIQWNRKAQSLGSLSGHNLYIREWMQMPR